MALIRPNSRVAILDACASHLQVSINSLPCLTIFKKNPTFCVKRILCRTLGTLSDKKNPRPSTILGLDEEHTISVFWVSTIQVSHDSVPIQWLESNVVREGGVLTSHLGCNWMVSYGEVHSIFGSGEEAGTSTLPHTFSQLRGPL